MLRVELIFLLSLFTPLSFLSSQSIDYIHMTKAINEFAKSAVYIESPQGTGTGTLFKVPINDTSTIGITYVATARHVLFKTDSFQRIIGLFDTVLVYMNRLDGQMESRRYGTLYISDSLDVAVLYPIDFKRPFKEYDTFIPSVRDIAKYS